MRFAPALALTFAGVLQPVALAAADALPLALPIDCTLGEDCFVLNYVDHDPGPGARDFTCGPMSYDGHKGTDIALPSFAAMRAGVAVRAAAPGVVGATRDGMPDLGLDDTPPALLEGKDCGNGVVIDHGDGWETQYCHLREGSLLVGKGDRVTTGAKIGLVGYSGVTEYPHVHLSVRHDGAVVDPFDRDDAETCGNGDGPEDDLWSAPPGYDAGGIVATGIATHVPDYAAVKEGTADRAQLATSALALVGWALVHGGRAGDVVEITLTDPDGRAVYRREAALGKPQALLMRAGGRKRPADGWAAGGWRVIARLIRHGAVLDTGESMTRIGD